VKLKSIIELAKKFRED